MLAVVDRTFFVAVPVLVGSVLVGMPAVAGIWMLLGAIAIGLTGALAWLGRAGGARWRGASYTLVTLVVAIVSLWTFGPITGVGTVFGVAILFAGVFLSRRWLARCAMIAIAAIVVRASVGGAAGLPTIGAGHFEVPGALWIGTALASGMLMWIAIRVLAALAASLEQSYARAADAYQRETATREQLDSSRQQLEELAQVEMVGRLAAGVAHDVNNALAAILAASDVLTGEVTTPDQRRHLTELEAASYHAAALVRDLLWIGRKFPPSTVTVAQLGVTVRACLERLDRVARTVTLDIAIDPALRVAISPEHLEQVLFGLVVRAHRSGITKLALTSEATDDAVALVLRGLDGAPAGDRPHGMQVQLGVSAARELVALSGGTLTMTEHSERTDQLLVRITLPLAPRDRGLASEPPVRLLTALVVEDEPMVLRRLCQLVARRGYEVRGASTVAEGLALLDTDPDLIVTDLQLPDGSGEQIAIAAFERVPTRPIIVCSGYGADDALLGRLRSARLVFLAKPFTADQLAAAIPDARPGAE